MSSIELFKKTEAAAWERVGETPRNVLEVFPPAVSTLKVVNAKRDFECKLEFAHGQNLSKLIKQSVLQLVKKNMEDIYKNSSWGWNEKKKLRELTHEEARYLLVKEGERLVAFLHFRFEVVHKTTVVYCYEIQVEEDMVGLGIGKRLMVLLEILARKFDMDKVMLTVLDQNPGAKAFYLKMGYKVDDDEMGEEDDGRYAGGDSYEILSKSLKKM